jgi:hypothetical protein
MEGAAVHGIPGWPCDEAADPRGRIVSQGVVYDPGRLIG